MKYKVIITCLITLLLCGCGNTWHKSTDWVWHRVENEMEKRYGKPRTTFYTCPYAPNQVPRMPIYKPICMMKSYDETEWGLSTSAKIHTSFGDYFPIDYMYGDSLCLIFHCPKYIDSSFCGNMVFHHPELWVQMRIHDLVVSEYYDKKTFEKSVGYDIVDKMVSPDYYYKLFLDDENALPWIPDSIRKTSK